MPLYTTRGGAPFFYVPGFSMCKNGCKEDCNHLIILPMNRKLLTLLLAAGTLVASQAVEPVRGLTAGVKQISTAGHAATPHSVFAEPVVKSPVKVLGEAPENTQEVPFTHRLGKSDAETKLYDLTDANLDGRTWKIGGFTAYSVCMAPNSADVEAADDWLWSPPVHLEAGKTYRVTLDCGRSTGTTPEKEERMEIKFGSERTVSGMTHEAMPAFSYKNKDFETFDHDFTVEEEGYYYFGIHCLSPKATSGSAKVCNFGVKVATPKLVPAAAGTLTYVPGEKGSLVSACTYTAPTVDVEGGALDAITKVTVLTNGKETHEFTDVTPGETIDFETTFANHGNNRLEAVAYRYDVAGETASISRIWAGPDTPCPVTNVQVSLSDDFKHVTLSWDPITEVGEHGGWVDASQAVYYVFDAFGSYYDPAIAETEETSVTFDYSDMEGQDFMAYQITAGVGYNYSLDVASSIVTVGTPEAAPWKESFVDGKQETVWCIDPKSSQQVMYGIMHDNEVQTNIDDEEAEPTYLNSQDGDNGFFLILPMEKDAMFGIFTTKISLAALSNPVLEFYYQGKGSALDVLLAKGVQNFEEVRSIDLREEPTDDWTRCTISLADFKDLPYIQVELRVRGIHNDETTTWSVPIDNVRVRDLLPDNLAIASVGAPAEVKAGDTYVVTTTVENSGSSAAEGAVVELYAGGTLVDSKQIGTLEPYGRVTVSAELGASLFDPATIALSAKVVWDKDMDTSDNEGTATVKVTQTAYPTVTGVEGKSTLNGVWLKWTAPDFQEYTEAVSRTEDFESADYEPLTNRDFGGWTLLDLDGGKTYTYLNDVNNPYRTQPMAYQLYNPVTAGVPEEYLIDVPPHSGETLLVAWSTNGPNDNWLISPELSGAAQTVSFWARSFTIAYGEEFEVYYSLTGKEVDDFVKVDEVVNYPEGAYAYVPEDWTEFSFAVPEGARYFAVRHTSYDTYALYLDDFVFETSGELPSDIEITGYNIYRNHEKVVDEPVTDTSWTDGGLESDTYTYHVTAVYNYGESPVSAPCEVAYVQTGVKTAETAGDVTVKADGGCIVVDGAEGMPLAVASVDGKTLSRIVASAHEVIPVSAGVYLVRAGDKVVKVVVK